MYRFLVRSIVQYIGTRDYHVYAYVCFISRAAMVELVDTQDSKFCVRKDVPVQVRLAVPDSKETVDS
jgi:hypothetical protein